jgi:eukaryotic-like serine/threonine-protein kinase
MVVGRQAFAGSTGAVIAAAILHQQPPNPRALRPDVSDRVEQVILKAVEKDRELRYQHASDIRADLERLKRDADSAPMRTAPTPAPAGRRPGRWVAAGVAVAGGGVLLFATVGHFYSQHTRKLTDKDTIVVADFTNTAGDPVFDGTLRRGLAIQLEQSPFLSLVSESRIQQTLVLMGQPAAARLTPEIAREVCERTGSAAVLDGSIANLGSQYVLSLQASNCRTGDVLDAEQVQASRKEDVLNALSQVATTFRARVGESLATVEKHSTPLPEATTPSFEALKAYSTGLAAESSSGMSTAVPLYKRAVEIDSQFARAWAALGLAYSVLGESRLSIESTTRAYQLRDRASDRERFFITLMYDRQVTGNLEKAKETLRAWADTYPRDVEARGLLGGFTSQGAGLFDMAIETSLKAIEIDPSTRFPYANLAYSYAHVNRFDAAAATIQQAAQRGIDMPEMALLRFYLAFLKDDGPGMEREAAQTRGKPEAEDWMLQSQSLVQARAGRLELARTLSRRAVDLAQQAGQRERAALYLAGAATWEAFFGNMTEARRTATEALGLSRGRDVEYGAGFALARVGDEPRVQALVRDLQVRFPEDTCARFTYVPTLRALIALREGDPAKADELLQASAPYELAAVGVVFNGFFGGLYPAYVHGEAYRAAGKDTKSAGEFRKIVTHRGIVLGDPVDAMARLQLARGFVRAGDIVKARNAYDDALTVWKTADPDVPAVRQARAEHAALH